MMNNSFWTAEELSLQPLASSQVLKSDRYKAGDSAVQAVESRIGVELPERYRRLIRDEGFVVGSYYDDKGVLTTGMGQTGEYMNTSPIVAVKEKEAKATMLVDGYVNYDEDTKGALLSASYRGDMSAGDKWLSLFNKGDYDKAAKEFLNHNEYKARKKANKNDGVVKRLEDIADKIKNAEYSTDSTNIKAMAEGNN